MIDYAPLEHEPFPKRLLVVGSARSGTMFFANFLRQLGMRVAHERMGEDGTVNWAWLAMRQKNDPVLHTDGRQHYTFDRIIHLVRHPLRVIPSLSCNLHEVFWKWQETHSRIAVPDPSDLERVAAFWVFWTDGCQHLCDGHIRLEDVSHLGPPVNAGPGIDAVKLDDLGEMAETVAQRMELYGYAV